MADAPYIKRYEKGTYDIRILRGQGRFAGQIYVDGTREDVLTHPDLPELEKKIDRYLAADATSAELNASNDELVKARQQVTDLTKTLTESGDSNARAAQLEKELDDASVEIKDLTTKLADANASIDQLKIDLAAAKRVKKTKASTSPSTSS